MGLWHRGRMKPTWFRRRRRLWSIISFLAIVGFIFLLFQVFSLELLNSQQRQNAKKTIIEHELRDKDLKPSPLYDLNVGPQRDMDLVFEKELYKGKLRDKLKFNRTKYLNKHGVVNKDDVADDEKESLKNLLKDDIKVDHVDEEKLQKNTELKFEKDRKTEIKFGKQNLDKLVGVKPVLGVVKQSKTFFGDLKWISYGDEVHLRTEGAAPVGDDKNMVVLGVHPQKIGLYAPDKNGMFTCLESQVSGTGGWEKWIESIWGWWGVWKKKQANWSLRSQWTFNSSLPSGAYICQWIGSVLVQIMVCCLFGAKLLSEPMLVYRQLDFWEWISMKL